MSLTPVYIVCSPRPLVGKTLIVAAVERIPAAEKRHGQLLRHQSEGAVTAGLSAAITETADIDNTFGKMQLMDRLIVDDGVAKVIDLGFHAFDEFFKMCEEIGFLKEAARRRSRRSSCSWPTPTASRRAATKCCGSKFRELALVTIDNEYVVRGELPAAMSQGRMLRIAALPAFLKTYIDRLDFLVHRLSAQREGFLDRTAPMVAPKLSQFPRAGAEFDFAEVVTVVPAHAGDPSPLAYPSEHRRGRNRPAQTEATRRMGPRVRARAPGRRLALSATNAPRTPSAFAPARPSPAISPRRRDPAGR